MRRRICLVTSGQPSTNPRLVKEADTLAAAGHSVHVIGAHRSAWADASDQDLMAGRQWTSQILQWRHRPDGSRRWATTLRHRMARLTGGLPIGDRWLGAAVSPVTPELAAAALAHPADLYIAHNLGALPAAARAAVRHRARLGFDAEDFHSGQFTKVTADARVAAQVERRFIPQCDYLTASAPGVAERYAPLCAERAPIVLLNVFPLHDRPAESQEAGRDIGPWRLYWFSQTIGRDRGLEDAVSAMAQLSDLNVELHVRGEWQRDYEGRLRGLATKVGLRPQQLVAHPPAPAAQMVRLAAMHDVGLALEPACSENNDLLLSNKLFTYLLAGVPVLASATTGQRAFTATLGSAARTVPVGDVNAIAGALRQWITTPAELANSRNAAWELGTRRFNWDLEQQKFLAVVDRVLARRPASGLRVAEQPS